MIRVDLRLGLASLALLGAAACGRSQGVPDQDLGGLVVETTKPEPPIKVERAAKEPPELGRALMQPYRKVVEALGPHTVSISTVTSVEEAGKPVSELTDRTTIQLGETGTFRGEYTNSADYGREAIFVGGMLYLRPRYQRWHRRAPETADEPAALRDSFFDPIAATWDLVAPGAELTDQGAAEVGGRQGKKIAIKLSPSPTKPPAEPLVQRKWRENRVVEELTGEVILDAEKGTPLAVKIAGTIAFTRDGRRFRMKTSVTSAISGIGAPASLTAPADTEVVATPERRREVDDRDTLLEGIAPPLRKKDSTP